MGSIKHHHYYCWIFNIQKTIGEKFIVNLLDDAVNKKKLKRFKENFDLNGIKDEKLLQALKKADGNFEKAIMSLFK